MATPQMLKTLSLTERLQQTKFRAKFILNWNSVAGQLEYRPALKESFTWYLMAILLPSELFLFIFAAFLLNANAFDITFKEFSQQYTNEMVLSIFGHMILCLIVFLQYAFFTHGDDLVTYINKLYRLQVTNKRRPMKFGSDRLPKKLKFWLNDLVGMIGYVHTLTLTIFDGCTGTFLGLGILEPHIYTIILHRIPNLFGPSPLQTVINVLLHIIHFVLFFCVFIAFFWFFDHFIL